MGCEPEQGWREVEALLEAGVGELYTAAAAVVGVAGEVRWQGAAGRLSREPDSPSASLDTVFDLASLTKPLATALAVLLLAQADRVSLREPLRRWLPAPWLPPDKGELTLTQLLTHRGGLPAWRPLYAELLTAPAEKRPRLLPRLAAAVPLEHRPDTVTLYSDLGFMLLQGVVEEVAGLPLDEFCRRHLYEPLGLTVMGFTPRQRPGGDSYPFAATEPGLLPARPPAGEVHDENAWAAGGVAGHAGLFGTAREVFALVAALGRAWQGEAVGPLCPEWVRRFLTPPPGAARALGFDRPPPPPEQGAAGRYFSPASVGHLGFTGTSFWLEPATGQVVVLLTNRVHLGREDTGPIRAFRPRFHDAACRALGCAFGREEHPARCHSSKERRSRL
ncbi:MAG: beta-lactamase family protein [Syntrophobacterales bacterium]|nr:beta-lactamase family protein [Syntrophobacterales bacterium]